MTNGEKFKEVFKISQVDEGELYVYAWLPTHDAVEISLDWWDAEYEEPTTKNNLGVDNQNIRLIDANALIKRLRPKHFDWWGEGEQDDFSKGNNSMLEEVIEAIEEFPSVSQIRPKGHWIENAPQYDMLNPQYICSECGNAHTRTTPYCEMCGAKMVELQESEDNK